jgi:2-iminobutanoate/2-iminopropanoate deaminase
MPKTIVRSDNAPAPVASYSQAVRAGEFLFLSGQLGLDPKSGQMVPGGVEAETRQILENLGAVLAAASATFDDVVKATVYLADMEEFAAFNAVYAQYFEGQPPARVTIGVAALPRKARVEIEAIALIPNAE